MSDAKLDLHALMQQAQELSEKLRRAQEELRHRTVSTTVGGGMVEVTANGALELVRCASTRRRSTRATSRCCRTSCVPP